MKAEKDKNRKTKKAGMKKKKGKNRNYLRLFKPVSPAFGIFLD